MQSQFQKLKRILWTYIAESIIWLSKFGIGKN